MPLMPTAGGGQMPAYAPPGGGYGGEQDSGGGQDVDSLLQRAAQYAEQAIQAEPDHLRSQAIAKALQALYNILGQTQKEDESAMGIGPQHKAMARAYGS